VQKRQVRKQIMPDDFRVSLTERIPA